VLRYGPRPLDRRLSNVLWERASDGNGLSASNRNLQELVERTLAGDAVACGRLLTLVEAMDEMSDVAMIALFRHLGRARRIGLTGPPGAGKSSLCLHLARIFRSRGLKAGMVVVDPTSPVSGGAVLGDRIRMNELATDRGVFIRSLASRGSFGGLSLAAGRVADVLDAFGCDVILLETVGMGQVGDDIREQSTTTVVVLVPESGDGVQVMKAGIIELADVLVVNKSDRPGARELVRQLESLPRERGRDWSPPVLGTSAQNGDGIEDLVSALDRHHEYLEQSRQPCGRDDAFWRRRFARLAENAILRDFRRSLRPDQDLDADVQQVLAGRRPLETLLAETLASFYRARKASPSE
jgi:LAO/AO transport system kinase